MRLLFTHGQVPASPFWYNENVSEEYMYFPKWYKSRIILISDILDGNILAEKNKRSLQVIFWIMKGYIGKPKGLCNSIRFSIFQIFGSIMATSVWLFTHKGSMH